MEPIERQVRQWLEQVVIGLNLCPFAGVPYRSGRVRITVSPAATSKDLLVQLQNELLLLRETPRESLETTLLVVPGMLAGFDDYNQFLDQVDSLLRQDGWEEGYQVASFHPQYRFAETETNDPGNLTNRSPWPILHILREVSIDEALAEYPEPESIPEGNIELMNSLSPSEIHRYFPWLPSSHDDAKR